MGVETWSLTLREEHRLRVYENRVLRKIFGPKRDEVTGSWRIIYRVIIKSFPNYEELTIRRSLCNKRSIR
jgi:hypothetical protein